MYKVVIKSFCIVLYCNYNNQACELTQKYGEVSRQANFAVRPKSNLRMKHCEKAPK